MLELASITPIVVPILFVGINFGIVIQQARVNDMACRSAARAAAQFNNKEESLRAAEAAVKSYEFCGKRPRVLKARFNYQDQNGEAILPNFDSPRVTVVTRMEEASPLDLKILGVKLNNFENLERSYTFPIIKLTTSQQPR